MVSSPTAPAPRTSRGPVNCSTATQPEPSDAESLNRSPEPASWMVRDTRCPAETDPPQVCVNRSRLLRTSRGSPAMWVGLHGSSGACRRYAPLPHREWRALAAPWLQPSHRLTCDVLIYDACLIVTDRQDRSRGQ